MKKFILGTALLLAACSNVAQYGTASTNDSMKTRMRACLVTEANNRLQAGTLFTQGLQATADDMVNTCLKRLALESAGISAESQSTAQSIIESLKNFGTVN